MGQPLSLDLRTRWLAAIDAERAVAPRRHASGWRLRWRSAGRRSDARPAASHPSRRAAICAPAVSRGAVRRSWRYGKRARTSRSMSFASSSPASACRWPTRHCTASLCAMRSREKNTTHAIEQDPNDVLKQRWAWFAAQLDLAPERLVFIHVTWAATKLARGHVRARKGERLRMGVPHGHRKTMTLVAGVRMTGMISPKVLDGPMCRIASVPCRC